MCVQLQSAKCELNSFVVQNITAWALIGIYVGQLQTLQTAEEEARGDAHGLARLRRDKRAPHMIVESLSSSSLQAYTPTCWAWCAVQHAHITLLVWL